jgi:type IV secretory pathway VirJ component
MKGVPIVCIYGQEESGSLCPEAPPGLMEVMQRPGRHGLGKEGAVVAEMLLKRLGYQ